jgi:hypothetical protein
MSLMSAVPRALKEKPGLRARKESRGQQDRTDPKAQPALMVLMALKDFRGRRDCQETTEPKA